MRYEYILLILLLLLATQTGIVLSQTPHQELSEVDETITTIDIHKSGDAFVSIQSRILLKTDNDTETFQEIKRNDIQIENNYEQYTEKLVETANKETNQKMQSKNGDLKITTTNIPRKYGIITYTFTWSNFGFKTNESINIQNTFSNYILSNSDTVKVLYPNNYTTKNIYPQQTETTTNTITWSGPIQFPQKGLNIILQKNNTTINNDITNNTNNLTNNQSVENNTNTSSINTSYSIQESYINYLLIGIFVLSLVLISVSVLLRRNRVDKVIEKLKKPFSKIKKKDKPKAEPDEEKVLEILNSSEEGKIEQKRIEKETGWSSAKVSQITKKLEEQDKIEKLRMGRKNIITKNKKG